jgi:hypothetical protein
VVDFQGEGITSRAVIRKGTIVWLDSYSTEGQTYKFFNEEGRQLTEKDGLCVWVDKHQHPLKDDSLCTSTIPLEKRSDST